MNTVPWQGRRTIERLGPGFYEPVEPARFPEHRLRWRNDRAAATVGLADLEDTAWLDHFARFRPLPDSLPQPLALAYHGHQFRSYNPQIGDGRGFLFAQGQAEDGRLLDLGTKGSGRTPFSRTGDGRLTLKGGVREILATEMLTALGVNTSQTLSLVETGEALVRGDEPSPTRSAVMVRLSHGHIRIGTFQRLAVAGDGEAIAALTDYTLRELYGVKPRPHAALDLLERVVGRTADLAASYMVAGFVHGVLNSDNINVTGESFDYGPWRFAPTWDSGFTAAYFDETGLYAFGRQAEAILWDVAQFARSLALNEEMEALGERLDGFAPAFHEALGRQMGWRLGVGALTPEATGALATALAESRVSLDRFWADWRGSRPAEDRNADYDHPAFTALRDALPDRRTSASGVGGIEPVSMLIDEVEAIWAAIDEHDDWQPLQDKVAAIRRMGAALSAAGVSPAVARSRSGAA